MFELFVAGSFFFWLLVVAEIVCLFLFVEWENGFGATVSVLVFGALLQWFGNVDIIGYCAANPWYIAALVGVYFVFGVCWAIVKWRFFCVDRLEDYEELKSEFLRNKGVAEGTKIVPAEHRTAWKEMLERHRDDRSTLLSESPKIRHYKALWMRWMSFWPISFIWGIINDFVKRVCKMVYQRLATFLQSISDAIFAKANVDADLEGTDTD